MLNFKRKLLLITGIFLIISVGTAHALPTISSDYEWINSAYWSLTDKTTGTDGEATFSLLLEYAAYESNFGLYTVNDLENPDSPFLYQVFGASQEPGNVLDPTQQSVFFQNTGAGWEISLDETNWSNFGDVFGFYFEVTNTQHTYFSDSRLNSPDPEQAYEHVLTAFDGSNKAFIFLEDLPGLGDRDFQDMVVQAIDVAPAPVPEPGTMVLLGVGLIGLAGIQRKKFVKK